MTNYRVFVGNHTFDVTIGKTHLLINGNKLDFDMESLHGNGMKILRHPNRIIEAYVESNHQGCCDVQINGKHLNAEVDYGYQPTRPTKKETRGALYSPMPGLITEIRVQEGDFVQEGDTLLVQEAMKMQMKLRAACSGRVEKIITQVGKQVEKDTHLVTVTPRDQ
jgi:biotin carboxyl carrier protein